MIKRKTWIKVKRGILEPKHRVDLGIRVWLYLHILDRADWETGKILEWIDESEAQVLDMPVNTLRKQRRQLGEDGYITSKQKKHCQEVTIHNWTDPRKYDGEEINKGGQKQAPSEDIKGDQSEGLPLGLPLGLPQGYTADGDPSLESHKTDHISNSKKTPAKEQNTWVKVLVQILHEKYSQRGGAEATEYQKYWQPTELHSSSNGVMKILCSGEDPEYQRDWLNDRGNSVVERMLVGILGEKVSVEFITLEGGK